MAGKKSCCTYAKLIKHRSVGGAGSIDLLIADYYLASILTQPKEWLLPFPNAIWGTIKTSYTPGHSLYPWLVSLPLGARIPTPLLPTMTASIKAWKILIQSTHSYPHSTTLKIPITALHHIMDSISFTSWQSKDIKYVNDLFDNVKTLSYP